MTFGENIGCCDTCNVFYDAVIVGFEYDGVRLLGLLICFIDCWESIVAASMLPLFAKVEVLVLGHFVMTIYLGIELARAASAELLLLFIATASTAAAEVEQSLLPLLLLLILL